MGLHLTLFAAIGLADIWVYFLVAVALGMVIFVHELGHFAVAKLCGVRCDKFYLGFDIGGIKLARFRWGETEYGIGILPLGGYVKMLGQEDNPARLREEIERAKLQQSGDSAGGNSEPCLTEEEIRQAEQALLDPRSYLAKSVPQRMAIISAGVVMNMIFAFVAAVVVYWLGVFQPASGVAAVAPGQVAWIAGIRPGDEIIEIAGKPSPLAINVMTGVMLGDLDQGLSLKIRRFGVAEPFTIVVHPDRITGKPTIGVSPTQPTTTLFSVAMPVMPGSSAAEAQPAFALGDQIVAVNGQSIDNYAQLMSHLVQQADQPLEFTVERELPGKNTSSTTPATERLKIRVLPNPIQHLGLAMAIGDITAIQKGSPAEKAGLKPGDRIKAINSKPVGDPISLPDRWLHHAGETVTVSVLRAGAKQPIDIQVTLRKVDWLDVPAVIGGMRNIPMPFPAMGVAYTVLNRIESVEPNSPAAEADLKPGDVITAAKVIPPERLPLGAADIGLNTSIQFKFGEKEQNWPGFSWLLQNSLRGSRVKLTLENEYAVTLLPVAAKDRFSFNRGFFFEPKQTKVIAHSFGEALSLGGKETIDATTMIYRSLQRLVDRQISPTQLTGPIGIFRMAANATREGLSPLLLFLTMLSANLAVINFLPIPILDGGHMVFLAWEGIVGKPASERVQVALTYVGLLFILCLMIFVVGLDVFHLIFRW